MILHRIAEKLKRRSKDDFKGRHFEAHLIVQAVLWYCRYPLSYRNLEEMFTERGIDVDHSTINRWVLQYALLLEERLRRFKRPHCGSFRIDETYVKVRGKWKYLYRAIDRNGTPIDFMLSSTRDAAAAKRFFGKMLKAEPLLAPNRVGTDGDRALAAAVKAAIKDSHLPKDVVHYITKVLQQRVESDHFRVKIPMPRVGGFRTFNSARRTIKGMEALLWLRKSFGSSGRWTITQQNDLARLCFGLQRVNEI